MYYCSDFSTYTTQVRAKDKETKSLAISLSNMSSCFESIHVKLIDHSSARPIVLADEQVPVDGCGDQLINLVLNDVYYGNDMNITFYEVQFCLPNSQCILVSLYEINGDGQVIPTQTLTTQDLLLIQCY